MICIALAFAITIHAQMKIEKYDYRGDIRPQSLTMFREDSYDSTTFRLIDGTSIDSSGVFQSAKYTSVVYNVAGGDSLDLRVKVYAGNTRQSALDNTITDSDYMYFEVVDSTTVSADGADVYDFSSSLPVCEHFFVVFMANSTDHDSATVTPVILNRDQH
jgi:hypothetical protein